MKRATRIGLLVLSVVTLTLSLTAVLAQEATEDPVVNAVPTITPTPIPRPIPATVITEGNAVLQLYFDNVPQGRARLLHVYGEGVAGAQARFLGKLSKFYQAEDGFYGLIVANMEQNNTVYDLTVNVVYEDGTRSTIVTPVNVVQGGFIRQEVVVAPDKAYLLDTEIERNELARLESIFSGYTEEAMWHGNRWQLPIAGSELTSAFGAFRTFNDALPGRHTGWDLRATLGTPVLASNAGRVAFTGSFDIRGNFIAIDHGYGVYSTYSHLSQTHVVRGQEVTANQVIGMVGDTGRTSGPHFHWEMAVNGEWIDSADFTFMWLPGVR